MTENHAPSTNAPTMAELEANGGLDGVMAIVAPTIPPEVVAKAVVETVEELPPEDKITMACEGLGCSRGQLLTMLRCGRALEFERAGLGEGKLATPYIGAALDAGWNQNALARELRLSTRVMNHRAKRARQAATKA